MNRIQKGRVCVEPEADLDALSHEVIGAALEVHRQLGPGFLEKIYERSLALELSIRGLDFQQQVPIKLHYKGSLVGTARLDLVISRRLVVELKAVDDLHPIHLAQMISYLKATGYHPGLLINFNVDRLKDGIRRIVFS